MKISVARVYHFYSIFTFSHEYIPQQLCFTSLCCWFFMHVYICEIKTWMKKCNRIETDNHLKEITTFLYFLQGFSHLFTIVILLFVLWSDLNVVVTGCCSWLFFNANVDDIVITLRNKKIFSENTYVCS